MKIVTCEKMYTKSVNFVDENDVFVGYDTDQGCCEWAGWFISPTHHQEVKYSQLEALENERHCIDQYSFDPTFLQKHSWRALDAGEAAVFRLVADGEPDLFLHLFNNHNGYYEHGFEFKVGNETTMGIL